MFAPFSDEQLQELEVKFGRIAVVRGATPPASRWSKLSPEPPWELAFRAPTTGESDAFEGAANEARSKASALRTVARATVVAVSHKGVIVLHDGERRGKAEKAVRDAWDGLRADYPAVHMAAQGQIMELMGGTEEALGKE